MAIPQKQKRDILRTIGGFAAAGILAAGLIFLRAWAADSWSAP